MFKSIRSRLIASYLLVILLAMGIAALLAWSALDRAFLDVLRENLLAQARRVAQTIESNQTSIPAPPDAGPELESEIEPEIDEIGEALIVGPAILASGEAPIVGPAILASGEAPIVGPAILASGEALTGSEIFDLSPGIVQYSQASNAMPGYHTRVIDDDGVVILGSPAFDQFSTGETVLQTAQQDWESLFYDSEIAGNLRISPMDSRSQSATLDLLDRPEIQRALAGEPSTAVRTSSPTPQRRIMYAAYPIRLPDTSPLAGDDSPPVGGTGGETSPSVGGAGRETSPPIGGPGGGPVVSVVYIASPLPRLTLSLLPDYFGGQILGGASVAVALAGLVGLLLARQLTRPLRHLTGAASALAQGESVPPVPPASTSELDALGTAFNTMTTNLSAAHDALAAHAHQRETILNNLADAVLAADSAGNVILANPAASTLLEITPHPLHQAIRRTLDTEQPHTIEITARSQIIELLTTPLRDEDGRVSGAIAVGHDVTAYRQLDRLRANFVSDVSHELRTPLTAIKGFVETLQDAASDDPTVRDRFLNTIAVETERLIRLTNDLLLLTRADAGQLILRPAPTSLAAAIERAVAQLENHARDAHITITIEPPEPPHLALADANRIHQILVNLLDNAIKFTPSGGQISISFGRTGEQPSCTIADTGPGIPGGEIPHLFERFYRGDPSRARDEDQGGAGLGLSIVKAIVEAHGGEIWIESEPGQGTRVTFSLPPAS